MKQCHKTEYCSSAQTLETVSQAHVPGVRSSSLLLGWIAVREAVTVHCGWMIHIPF